MKSLFILILIIVISGCSQGHTTDIWATIVNVNNVDDTAMGCIGTKYHTVIETEDGRRDRICGIWGNVGDKIKGKWTEGASDYANNGFKPY